MIMCASNTLNTKWIELTKAVVKEQGPDSEPAENLRHYNFVCARASKALIQITKAYAAAPTTWALCNVLSASLAFEAEAIPAATPPEPCAIGGPGTAANTVLTFTPKDPANKAITTTKIAIASDYLPFVNHVYFLANISLIAQRTAWEWISSRKWAKKLSQMPPLAMIRDFMQDGTVMATLFGQFRASVAYAAKVAKAAPTPTAVVDSPTSGP